jgi:hypothetical protein
MAGNDDDFSTGEEWWLLRDVRAFVARYCGSETAAQELLLEFARRGHFRRYRWFSPEDWGEQRGSGIDPHYWGDWPVVVDCGASCVSSGWRGTTSYRMLLVRLHCDDVLVMLRAVGLLPLAKSQVIAGGMIASEGGDTAEFAFAGPTRLEKMKRSGFLKSAPALQAAADYAREAYPPHGCVPDDVTPAQFARGLEEWLLRQADDKKKTIPSQWQTSKRFLQEYRHQP